MEMYSIFLSNFELGAWNKTVDGASTRTFYVTLIEYAHAEFDLFTILRMYPYELKVFTSGDDCLDKPYVVVVVF